MGTLRYGTLEVEFNDMLLAHLQVLIGMKLRRRENFMLSWVKPHELGSGRQSLWIDNGFPISFEFDGGQFPQIQSGMGGSDGDGSGGSFWSSLDQSRATRKRPPAALSIYRWSVGPPCSPTPDLRSV